jgi:hypothetical protein
LPPSSSSLYTFFRCRATKQEASGLGHALVGKLPEGRHSSRNAAEAAEIAGMAVDARELWEPEAQAAS